MPRFPGRIRCLILAGVLGFGLAATAAEAGIQPALQINWSIDGGLMNNLLPLGTDIDGDGIWNYSGFDPDGGGSGINLSFDMNADPDPLLSGNIALFNTTGATIDVFVQIILPVGITFPSTLLNGSAALGLTTNGDGGDLTSVPGTAVWRAFIDGAEVAALFHDPFQQHNGGFGSSGAFQDFGIPNPIAGPALNNTVAIELRFTLTPSDQASITSVFNIVPGPGGLLVMAMGMVMVRRRRRTA